MRGFLDAMQVWSIAEGVSPGFLEATAHPRKTRMVLGGGIGRALQKTS
jgi:hypothetical protein